MRLRPFIARAGGVLAGLVAAAGLAGCATDGAYLSGGLGLHVQQPPPPANRSAEWSPPDRLYRAVTLEGVDRAANRAAMDAALDRANLRAPIPATARYALQVQRRKARGGEAVVSYRILDRAGGRPLFAQDVPMGRGDRADLAMTQFIVALGSAEHVTVATVVPCLDSAEVEAMKGAALARGETWRTDDCRAYRQGRRDGGVRFSSYR